MKNAKSNKKSRSNVFYSSENVEVDRKKIIEVKRRLTLGEGLKLIPTSEFEKEQLQKAAAERRVADTSAKKLDLSKRNPNIMTSDRSLNLIK